MPKCPEAIRKGHAVEAVITLLDPPNDLMMQESRRQIDGAPHGGIRGSQFAFAQATWIEATRKQYPPTLDEFLRRKKNSQTLTFPQDSPTIDMMRPQDILVLLAIARQQSKPWLGKDIAYVLGISGGEVSESLKRSKKAGLYDEPAKTVRVEALYEFMIHGMRYVFPMQLGAVTRGVPTSVSAPPLSTRTESSDKYVWPHPQGRLRGHSIEPLYPSVPDAALRDPELHALFSITDTLRAGKARERELARQELEKRLLGN